jgi:hypothetical protein
MMPNRRKCEQEKIERHSGLSAGNGEDLAAKLKESHQQKLALWQAIAGGPEPRCRDCADFDGRCQGDGLPCDPQERALERIARLRAVPQEVPIPPDTEAELLHSIELLMAQCEQLRGEYQRGLDDAIRAIRSGRDDWSSGEDIGKIINAILAVAEARIADLSRATPSLTRPQ